MTFLSRLFKKKMIRQASARKIGSSEKSFRSAFPRQLWIKTAFSDTGDGFFQVRIEKYELINWLNTVHISIFLLASYFTAWINAAQKVVGTRWSGIRHRPQNSSISFNYWRFRKVLHEYNSHATSPLISLTETTAMLSPLKRKGWVDPRLPSNVLNPWHT